MIEYPSFDPVAFSIGPIGPLGTIRVHWYGIMYLVGFAAAWWLGRLRARKPGSSWRPGDVDDLIFFSALGVILGGRLGWVIVYGHEVLADDALAILKVWQGGMSFHGGLAGVMIALAIFARRRQRAIADVFDFTAPLPAVGLFAGRIGNFINGELWGKPTSPDAPWAVIVDGQARHATQLYELFLEGIVLFFVLWLYTKKPRPVMAPSGLFLVIYGVSRVAIEFVREPDQQMGYLALGWITMGQVLSAPMILAGVVLLVLAYRRQAET